MRKLLRALLLIVLVLMTQVCYAQEAAHLENYRLMQAYHRLTDAWAETLSDEEADAAFLGDSITAGGKWDEYYPDYLVENLGVVADNIPDVHSRLVLLEALKPAKCFLMIGINDLCLETEGKDAVARIAQAYDQLLFCLSEMSEDFGMTVYVQSILPILEGVMDYPYVTNAAVRGLNAEIREMAESHGMAYIDIHSLMADENGQLKAEYTSDGLHLLPNAYDVWSQALIPYLEE